MAERQARRLRMASWLLKNYLFMRVRLVNPDRFLGWLLGRLSWMFTPAFGAGLACYHAASAGGSSAVFSV